MTLAEKQQKRGQLIEQMRALQAKADAEKRSLSAEETTSWDALDADQDKLRLEIESDQKASGRSARMAELEASIKKTSDSGARPQPGGSASARAMSVLETAEYRSAFDAYLRGELDMREVRSQVEARVDTLQVGLFAKGGALVMPQQMAAGLIQAVDDETFMLALASVERVTQAESLGIGTLDTDVDDPDWTAELKTGNQSDLAVGKREMRPHPLAKRVLASNTLLRRTAGGAEALVNRRLAYKFGIAFEKGCLTGDGVRKPLGVFIASNDGVPTSRDVSTGNTATAIQADGLIEAKHSIKAAYWPRLTWMFHRDAVKQIRKLKDGNGQYLWAPGLSGGLPDRILEAPYKVSEYAPNTFTTGLYVGAIGDFSYYQIVIALDMTVQRLTELYAESNKTGFIGRMEADGQPVLAEAFARVKLG
jgi:HK97 family phage major capsid protein